MPGEISFSCLTLLNRFLSQQDAVSKMLTGVSKMFNIQSEITRLSHPALDSYILAQFFTYIATMYNFNQIFSKIRQTIYTNRFQNLGKNYNHTKKDYLRSSDQVLGIEIALHGRIPREPVRPRKTVQLKMLGSSSTRVANQNTFLLNRAESVNPELGTFTFWVRIMV